MLLARIWQERSVVREDEGERGQVLEKTGDRGWWEGRMSYERVGEDGRGWERGRGSAGEGVLEREC